MNLDKTRQWFIQQTGHPAKFVTVAHDGYDKKWKSRLGASVHFCNPSKAYRQLDIGIMILNKVGKSAAQVAATILEIGSEHYGLKTR